MMYGHKMMGAFALLPATLLLIISFFVLVVSKKQEGSLKIFGLVLAVLLWVSAALALASGAYTMKTGKPLCPMMKHMMMEKMEKGPDAGPMMQHEMKKK